MRTDKLADQHYKRVSNFAKEMLVWPDEIDIHKIKNDKFIGDVKPPTLPLLPTANLNTSGHVAGAHSVDLSMRGATRISGTGVRYQPPMKFGSY